MQLNIFHFMDLKYYEAYHNDQSEPGGQIVKAQNECFKNEGLGVHLNNDKIERLMGNIVKRNISLAEKPNKVTGMRQCI